MNGIQMPMKLSGVIPAAKISKVRLQRKRATVAALDESLGLVVVG